MVAKRNIKKVTKLSDFIEDKISTPTDVGITTETTTIIPTESKQETSLVEQSVVDEKNHTYYNRKLFNKLKNRLNAVQSYFRISPDKTGVIINRTINDEYSTIKIKFLYSHKKIIFIIRNDNIEYTCYERSENLVKDIESIFIPVRETEIVTYDQIKNQASEILGWGFLQTQDKKFNKVFAVSLNKDNINVSDRVFHLLYFGVITHYEIISEDSKTNTIKCNFKFLENGDEVFQFTIKSENSQKLKVGNLIVFNKNNQCNIFNMKGIKSLIDFSSIDYKNITRYLISIGEL